MFKFEGMNFNGSLRVNNEKTKGRRSSRFPLLIRVYEVACARPESMHFVSAFTTRNSDDARQQEKKGRANIVCSSGTRFQIRLSLFYLASRVEFLFPFATILAFPRLSAFFLKASSIRLKSNGPVASITKKKKKKIAHETKIPCYRLTTRILPRILIDRSIDRNDISIVSKQLYSLFPLVSDQFNVDSLNKPRFNRLLALF